LLLEKERSIASSWKEKRCDKFHLHTARFHAGLPFVNFPSSLNLWPTQEEVANYLEGYATMTGLRKCILFNHAVSTAEFDSAKKQWNLEVDYNGETVNFSSKFLVIATGHNATPKMNVYPGQSSYMGEIIHSSKYEDGQKYKGKRVLIVGFGNSASEIAMDLWSWGAFPTILARGSATILSRKFMLFWDAFESTSFSDWVPFPFKQFILSLASLFIYGDLKKYGLRPPSKEKEFSKAIVIDHGTVDLIKKGEIRVMRQEIDSFTETGLKLANGVEETADVIIMATGFQKARALANFLEDRMVKKAVSEDGSLVDKVLPEENMYFVGFDSFNVGKFQKIGLEAEKIADSISNQLVSEVQ